MKQHLQCEDQSAADSHGSVTPGGNEIFKESTIATCKQEIP